jgi:hypothetical protein
MADFRKFPFRGRQGEEQAVPEIPKDLPLEPGLREIFRPGLLRQPV